MKEVSANVMLKINGGAIYNAVIVCKCGAVFKSGRCTDKAVAKILVANKAASHMLIPGHSIKRTYFQ